MVEQAVAELIKSPRLPDHIKQLQDYLAEEQERRRAFHANLPEGKKVEFINGQVVEAIPVKKSHTIAVKFLLRLLDEFVIAHELWFVGFEKCLISLDRNDYEPDICFWARHKSDTFADGQVKYPAPDFIAEVISPSTEVVDRVDKFRDYAANGVREYWIIHPDAESVEQYVLEGSVYILQVKLRIGDIESEVIPGFVIPVPAIFDVQTNRDTLRKIINS
jgi:Uma2 family endonuclease